MGIPDLSSEITVEDYLHGEPLSDFRHEFINGEVYAMAGGSSNHNSVCMNFGGNLHSHLRGKSCRVFVSDMKVRILADKLDIFYYPDVMVGSDPRDSHPLYLRFPKLIIEVLSKSTERVDRNEKFLRYLTIPTLEEYVLAEQKRQCVTIYRRSESWRAEVIDSPDLIVKLQSVGLELPLAAFYENVVPREEDEEL